MMGMHDMDKYKIIEQGHYLLGMIDYVLKDDTDALDEIDARFWCFLNGLTFLKPKMGRDLKGGTRIIGYRTKELGDISTWLTPRHPVKGERWLFYRCRYTRSRDALKMVRPDGWCITSYTTIPKKGIALSLYHYGYGKKLHGRFLPTEELAELYTIIQAYIWDLENGN